MSALKSLDACGGLRQRKKPLLQLFATTGYAYAKRIHAIIPINYWEPMAFSIKCP
ncbi:MAG: hypothetical protein V7L29_32390 [Nostoc sp.]|uniref:hypothetical protein n=1 Tax=Nostoc sp. TaxID=1180 RepID=UPI002FF65A54